jgi:hypothetical protein
MTEFAGSRRTVTQSVESEASRDEVVGVLAEATRIPEWAPAFVDRVTGDARSGWRATKDGRDFALRSWSTRVPARSTTCARSLPDTRVGLTSGRCPDPGAGASSV